ncbi:kinase-like domain-containing protein [Mycena albidolilacea]|uniref:Kinase-like domain-containing protein n=1 Tax=Mycena albidolilacea TaxID=1033008 RepID=A0AAD6ZA57_9AGAR|nr:kinase-like domain-containing protein [Mycena albidolilacea]
MSPSTLPLKTVEWIVYQVYLSCLSQFNTYSSGCDQHFCSPAMPCVGAQALLAPMFCLRLVDSTWNAAVKNFQDSIREVFFSRVEDGYYPHTWHINTRVRKSVLLSRYRVFRTIASEEGTWLRSRGVYLAYDIGGAQGCANPAQVIIKTWAVASDFECQREVAAYRALGGADPCPGVPVPRVAAAAYDAVCDVHALVLPKLGPTLEDLRALLPNNRFDARMVLVVAIEMANIHARGLIHSGIKPGNICIAPRGSADAPSRLYAIDFGFSFALDTNSPLPSAHRIDAVGNRRFMSVFAHHGISQSQRDDLESLAYLLSYLFHSQLPWDGPIKQNGTSRSRSPPQQQHVWRLKIATPAAVLFRDMDECFHEFWRDVKALAYAEVPDYDKMRARFADCLAEYNKAASPCGWWDIWNECSQ